MMDILACPKCKGDLVLQEETILCNACRLKYPVIDGIPDMLIEDATRF